MTVASRDIQVKHVNQIVTMVHDPQRSLAFYCDLLGFKQIPEWFLQRGTRFIDPGAQGAGASIHFADAVLPDLYQTGGLPHILDVPWVPQVPSGVS